MEEDQYKFGPASFLATIVGTTLAGIVLVAPFKDRAVKDGLLVRYSGREYSIQENDKSMWVSYSSHSQRHIFIDEDKDGDLDNVQKEMAAIRAGRFILSRPPTQEDEILYNAVMAKRKSRD